MLKAFLERRRLKKTFERYVSPDIARQLADGTFTATGPEQTERSIEFAFVAVSAPDAPTYSERAGIISDIAIQHEGVVHSLVPVVIIAFGVGQKGVWLAPFGLAIGVFVMAGSLSELAARIKLGKVPVEESLRRLSNQPRSNFGTTLAHFGVGLMTVGVVATSAYQVEKILVMKPGESVDIAGYSLKFGGITPAKGPNYVEQTGHFDVTRGGSPVIALTPSKRLYDSPPQPTTEAGIHASWKGDLYTVLGDGQPDGGYSIRLYFHPFVRFIWIGAVIMFLGGLTSLSDRRLRVGAPGLARRKTAAAPAE